MIRPCTLDEFDAILAVINDGSEAYRGVIADDCWTNPYMSADELRREIADRVQFWGATDDGQLSAVMGLQDVEDVALIRHAYTRTSHQGTGLGQALLAHLVGLTDRPVLVGTWKAATWAIAFYQRRGFRLVDPAEKDDLLRRYWSVPPRQMMESLVLADARWFASRGR